MRIRFIDPKTRTLKVIPEILDDLWHLEQIIEKNDLLSGSTDRKIKGKDENQKSQRIKLFVTIQVETAEFHRFSGVLRVNGTITEGKPADQIEIGAHQAIEIQLGEPVSLQKAEWKEHQIQRLKKAEQATEKKPVLLCVLDDESATFAFLKEFDLEPRGMVHADKNSKHLQNDDASENAYFQRITDKILELKPDKTVIAGPGFSKENVQKYWNKKSIKIPGNVFFESTNSVGITGLNEIVKSGALTRLVQETKIAQDAALMERFLKEIGTDSGLAVYGENEVQEAIQLRAVQELLISDQLLREKLSIQPLMQEAEKQKATIHIFVSESDPGKQLQGFGGIVAILKFKTKW